MLRVLRAALVDSFASPETCPRAEQTCRHPLSSSTSRKSRLDFRECRWAVEVGGRGDRSVMRCAEIAAGAVMTLEEEGGINSQL